MRIAAITVGGIAGWPTLELPSIDRGLNAIYGPPHSGKTALADLLAHALFGKPPATLALTGQWLAPPGEVVVDGGGGAHYRLRRQQDAAGPIRLTVASLNGESTDQRTIHKLVRGLTPTVLSALCAVSFRDSPDITQLLSAEFVRGCRSIESEMRHGSRRTTELTARRDLLAQELETKIRGERRVSKELEGRQRELDRMVHQEQQLIAALEQRFKAVESALAETDSRLRYRRLELNAELRLQPAVCDEERSRLAELDEQVAHWRTVLADMAQREANVRARLAQLQTARATCASAASEQRAWLAMARHLAADLTGEISRLARASASERCVCRDAHPRLRPIAETVERQLDLLEGLMEKQHRTVEAGELQIEVDRLAGSQAELRRHLERLLDRRQSLAEAPVFSLAEANEAINGFSAADAEQLETRRVELEQERFELVDRLRSHGRVMRDLRAQRETVERQRAALLSARSVEHVQRELAVVQEKLEQVASGGEPAAGSMVDDNASRASEFLAQLTNGELVRFTIAESGRSANVVDRAGEELAADELPAMQRDLVYLSLCMALLTAASRQGIWLPLVLDEPFERLDAPTTAALTAVLDDFCRQGHQVLVLTSRRSAVERLASIGAVVHDMLSLRHRPQSQPIATSARTTVRPIAAERNAKRRIGKSPRRKVKRTRPRTGDDPAIDQSDAA